MVCPQCSAEVQDGARFCTECGGPLGSRCPSCGAPHAPRQKFCGECGTALRAGASPPGAPSIAPAPELRLVSVLFVDIVGYTALSEARDAEDVRELLGRYFDSARAIVERYGGALEKFIGDAVMAVWGVPIAREDDAERAVRAGLEMVDAVAALGEEIDVPMQARGGIVTGQAASMDRPGEGLVVGDRVNTAARAQSAAEAGTVYVDRVTQEVTSLAIAYEDAGEHVVKGKSEPLRLWRAVRVVAGVGGSQREGGLEAPLVGRDTDLRLLKDLFHGALERRGARLVAISGEAGIGKSRLLWELDKYADGLAETLLWHTGRCLSHGEGVAYGALAEMVRQRLGIAQDAPAEDARVKLEAGLERWVPDGGDRDFLRPRLGLLLGLAGQDLERAELFAGWRMFFERLATQQPVVMVFEDLQWADEGMLDFIEHFLDWSSSSPVFILTLSRADVAARRGGWPAVRRGATLLQLEPLQEAAMGELLDAIVVDVPARFRGEIIARAEGVPLYAIETLRVLASRGVLSERDGRLAPVGELGALDVPASLSQLIAARLDALAPPERRLVKAMSVFGGKFPRAAAAELGDVPSEQLDEVLASLVRKQVLSISADPLSPERGQYGFSQGLLRTVAYEMLSRRERKPRHRAAAEYLRRAFPDGGEEVSEVIAAHYLACFRAARDDADAPELRTETIRSLRRAAQRAGAVGAPGSAERSYQAAAELAEDELERIELRTSAGEMALRAGHIERALEHFQTAAEAHLAGNRRREAALLGAAIGETLHRLERNEDAIAHVSASLKLLAGEQDRAELAALQAVLGKAHLYLGDFAAAEQPLQTALTLGRALRLPRLEARALIDKGSIAMQSDHEEARTLLEAALEISEQHGLDEELILARGNIGTLSLQWDLPDAVDRWAEALALSRRKGDRLRESITAGNLAYIYVFAGRWQEAETLVMKLLDDLEERPGGEFVHFPLALLRTLQGQPKEARTHLARMVSWERGDDDELRAIHSSLLVGVELSEGSAEQALARGTPMLEAAVKFLGVANDAVRNAWPETLEAALSLKRVEDAERLVGLVADQPRAQLPPYMRAQLARGGALAAAAAGRHDEVEAGLAAASEGFRTLSCGYWAARVQADMAGWLIERGRRGEAEPLLEEATETFAALGALPALSAARSLARSPTAGAGTASAGAVSPRPS